MGTLAIHIKDPVKIECAAKIINEHTPYSAAERDDYVELTYLDTQHDEATAFALQLVGVMTGVLSSTAIRYD